ncbi:TetR family transcriptional regulator [Vibrio sp. CAIM 722]|uniref:TetR family transcriptional regulator n=1 Tax=Vibrio eleionomae TaxID=2653505 RepID=A0A7X4LNV7_9VIBR|nr:TetR/AcrR family transcriptional regulator [Vibrio eleionomae]MZI95402.1 TetR family transcriptional regulator [Vibrio eleionomae]
MTEKRQGRRSAEDAAKTRFHILSVAADLFCEMGYARVSLRQISDQAGVSHSLLRHHFGSKEKIWHAISDGLNAYMSEYMKHVIEQISDSAPANIIIYEFTLRLLAHSLMNRQPIQLIADSVRQDNSLFDYYIGRTGEIETLMETLADDYHKQFPSKRLNIWEVKWELMMYAHSAASLTPFLCGTWPDAKNLDEILLKHLNMFNQSLIEKYHVEPQYILKPTSVAELVYESHNDWKGFC